MFSKKKRDKDCYIFIENGAIKEEEKVDNHIKIIKENNSNSDIDLTMCDINLNSSEYAHYVADNISNKLREEESCDKNIIEYLYKLYNGKIPKVYLQKILNTFSILTMCILIFTSIPIIKNITNKSKFEANLMEKTIQYNRNLKKDKESFEFLLNIIKTSNSNINTYYKELKSSVNSESDEMSFIYSRKISDCKKYIERDLEDIYKLDSYINTKIYENIINILIERYKLLINLCDKLLISSIEEQSQIYNSYANREKILLEELFDLSILYLQSYNISYNVDEHKNIYW